MSELLNQPDALRQLRLRGQQLAERIRLPLRNKIWRGGSGEFAGAGTGSSLEFQDHRAYTAGDDPRHINWQAYARTGQYSMKVWWISSWTSQPVSFTIPPRPLASWNCFNFAFRQQTKLVPHCRFRSSMGQCLRRWEMIYYPPTPGFRGFRSTNQQASQVIHQRWIDFRCGHKRCEF